MSSINYLQFDNQRIIPTFSYEERKLLQGFDVEIPKGTDTLANRVTQLNRLIKYDLPEKKANAIIMTAISIALLAGSALVYTFFISSQLSLFIGLIFFGVALTLLASAFSLDYIEHKSKHQALSLELAKDIHQAANFWQKHGDSLLEKVAEAMKNVQPVDSKPELKNASPEEKEALLAIWSKQLTKAADEADALATLSKKIRTAQQPALATRAPNENNTAAEVIAEIVIK